MEIATFDQLPNMVNKLLDKTNRIEALLIKPTETPKPQRFDFNGVLDYLKSSGYNFSKSQLQKKSASGGVPCRKFNNRLVFERNEIDTWIASNTVTVGDNSGDAALILAKSARCKK